MRSPEVVMTASSISLSLKPCAAISSARTWPACQSASGLPRVPIFRGLEANLALLTLILAWFHHPRKRVIH